MTVDYRAEAEALRDVMIARRRDFHQHPELPFEEVRTAGIVADALHGLGLEVRTGVGRTGVMGLLEGARDGPTVLVRADMDALPVNEENDAPYASRTPGKMHACGHDGHTAVALAVAQMLAAHRDRMAGRVQFVFQPAEEIAGGAKAMIADGALDLNPAASFAVHFWSPVETGRVAIGEGPIMAAADKFVARVRGSGGHGALPHETRDPVVAAAQIVVALQSIVSRNVAPTDAAVLSVGHVRAGEGFNVIPAEAELSGTLRTFRPEVRDLLIERMEAIVTGVAAALGCEATLEVLQLTPQVCNDPDVTAQAREAVAAALGADALGDCVRSMVAEDMSYFMARVPGCFMFVGSGNPRERHALPAPPSPVRPGRGCAAHRGGGAGFGGGALRAAMTGGRPPCAGVARRNGANQQLRRT
ncbi:MAG: amidohydrolase [Anaerolineae bacterium]|nr:amidohydrolase [Anaerolineae bacterium]